MPLRLLPLRPLLLFLCLLNYTEGAQCQEKYLSGQVNDSLHQALVGVSVSVKGTGMGTTTNVEGRYRLKLIPGQHVILFSLIGYQSVATQVNIESSNVVLDPVLRPSVFSLAEVKVNVKAENPALRIIRAAISKRNYYNKQASCYSTDVYIKGIHRLKDAPKKFLGQDITEELKDYGLDSGKRGILYLSESVSKLRMKLPSQIHEEIISSKVSGQNRSFSFNQASDLLLNFNQNRLKLGNIGQAYFVSPIADQAMAFYRFRLEGSTMNDGKKYYTIRVIPHRTGANLFEGVINIQDNTWALSAMELRTAKGADVGLLDTVQIKQQNIEPAADVFLPAVRQIHFAANVFKFKYRGDYLETFSSYVINPNFTAASFPSDVVRIHTGSNQKDSTYWNTIRPVPLSSEEKVDYVRKDSIFKRVESKHYLDSMDRKHNHLRPIALLLGGQSIEHSYRKERLSIAPLGFMLSYNTVEGLAFNPEFTYHKRRSDTSSYQLMGSIRYGFINKRLNPWLKFDWHPNELKSQVFEISGGSKVSDQNNLGGIDPLYNTYQTLFNKENILKLYEKQFLGVGWGENLTKSITFRANLEYANRLPLVNTAFDYLSGKASQHFSSNGPYDVPGNAPAFEQNRALTLDIHARFSFGEKFIVRPDRVYSLGSAYPSLEVNYRKGIKGLGGSSVDYDLLSASLGQHQVETGSLGSFNYSLMGGKFLNRKSLTYLDFEHFTSSAASLRPKANAFELLNTYAYSASDYYLHAHIEQNFKGAFLSGIPIIRRARLEELLGVSYLRNDKLANYTELYIGIERFNLRMVYTFSFIGAKNYLNGFTFSLGGF